jgi:iron complex transport system substrate-binding protein
MIRRIVSLEPSVTATLVALDARDRLVAVTRYCHRLADVGDLPQLETTWSVRVEDIAALRPDLVIAGTPYRAGRIDELLRARLNVLCLYPQTLADVYDHIRWLGDLCGVPERADALVAEMEAHLESFKARTQGKPRQRVYVETWFDPLMNAPEWVAEIVEALGGEFVPQPAGRRIDEAEIIAADPEVIVLSWAGMEEIDPAGVSSRPGWDQIGALREGRVVAVDEITLNAPGPNLKQGVREVWRALYPDEG